MFIATTSFTRIGIEACVDFAAAVVKRVRKLWLPLPVEVCRGEPMDLGPLERYLEPFLYLLHEVEGEWGCYETRDLRRRELAAVRLAALVIKTRVYGKINLREWDEYFTYPTPHPPTPAIAIGAIPTRDDIICGTHPPNPIELASEIWHKLPAEEKRELAQWIARYIAILTDSINIDEAYVKLLREGWVSVYYRLKNFKK